ncbi:MAG: biotin/lipoyl-containing protein, partial [Azovibrio sp.]
MSQLIEVKVPDIGDFDAVPIIDLFVKVGDTIQIDDAICTLESDKATMDVPSSTAGVVREILVKLGDKVAEGNVLIKVEATAATSTSAAATSAAAPAPAAPAAAPVPAATPVAAAPAASGPVEVTVPDIGDFSDVPVIEVYVKPGDQIKVDDALVTLESDKATMDVPSSAAGTVKEVKVKLGDKVSQGAVILILDSVAGTSTAATAQAAPAAPTQAAAPATPVPAAPAPAAPAAAPQAATTLAPVPPLGSKVHASPSVRAYARELGVNLSQVKASGPNGRILKEDVTAFVKGVLTAP